MYLGKNPSALRSQKWIAEALLELMQTKKFQSITIKEICQKADLTRQTFYQLYDSKEDIIRYLLSKDCDVFKNELLKHDIISIEILVSTFFQFFKSRKKHLIINSKPS